MNDKDLELLKEVIGGLGHMPSRLDLEGVGLSRISSKIQDSGGFCYWQKILNASPKVKRMKWTPDILKKELAIIADSLGKMPSAQDLKRIGRNDVGSYIAKNGGFEYWANQIGRTREHSDSDTGWDGEKSLMGILIEKGFDCEAADHLRCPYDLRVNSLLRIDVKSTNYAEYGACKGWFYRIGKDAQSDVIALHELDTKDTYFIPCNICPKTNITISRGGGKYAEFKNRFDLLEKLVKLKEEEQKIWPKI